MNYVNGRFAFGVLVVLGGALLLHCGSSSKSSNEVSCASVSPDAATTMSPDMCYPDNNGLVGGNYTIDLVVNDTGFQASGDDGDGGTKNIIQTENDAMVTLTLTNMGTTPHGFAVGCISVCPSYTTLPAGCSPNACFPTNSAIAPLAPGATMTITFNTPTPDGLLYPFTSNNPNDSAVPGLNLGQWSLM